MDWSEKVHGFPPFSEFLKFIVREANIACNPITSFQSLKGKELQRVSSFVTKLTETTNSNYNKCFLCDKTHRPDDCPLFLSKSLEDRRTFVKSNGICFGCLRTGHRSRFCRKRILCKTCTKELPTLLHSDVALNFNNHVDTRTTGVQTQDTEEHTGTSHLIDARNENMSSLILPVWVSHIDTPGKEILTYALLDAQSDTTFVADNTCDTLGINGCETQLTLSTMSAQNQVIKSSRVDGLVVRVYNNASKVSLPVAFSRSAIPVNRFHIPNPETAQQWPIRTYCK